MTVRQTQSQFFKTGLPLPPCASFAELRKSHKNTIRSLGDSLFTGTRTADCEEATKVVLPQTLTVSEDSFKIQSNLGITRSSLDKISPTYSETVSSNKEGYHDFDTLQSNKCKTPASAIESLSKDQVVL